MLYLKRTVLHYANLNSSSLNKHYLWVVEYAIFEFSFYVYFNDAFVKTLIFQCKFQNSFQDVVYYRILGCQTL